MLSLEKSNHKIFLAGGTGMVGSAIQRKLLNIGYNKKLVLSPPRSELDLLDYDAVKMWFLSNKPQFVILAAAKVGGIIANNSYPADFILENLKIQTNVIENSFKSGVRRLLFLGSSCIYPKFAKQPIIEESLLNGSLESTNECYAIAKIAGLQLCASLRSQYGFDTISLMPTNVYGFNDNYHKEDSHVMAALIRKFLNAKLKKLKSVTCWGTGEVFREFLHVDDLAEAVLFCLQNWYPDRYDAPKDSFGKALNHLNVGTGSDILIKDLAYKIAEIVGYEGEILWDTSKPNGTPKKLLNVSKINDLGWHSKISLDEGIKDTIKNFDFQILDNL